MVSSEIIRHGLWVLAAWSLIAALMPSMCC